MERLVLLDSNSLLNRAFYALPMMTSIDGVPTNAVYGYVNMLMKIIKEAKPTHIIATFDLKAPTFRKQMYSEYKAQRKGMPDELAVQLPLIKNLLSAMDIEIITLEGYEADDLIGTMANKCDFESIIVTGDRDSLQLVSDKTTVWLTKKGITEIVEYTPSRLLEDGLTPKMVIDLKSLMGDASDNIPGVSGVGEKTAKKLLSDFHSLDGVYENIDNIKGALKEKLINNKDMAYLSYKLATIDINAPIEFDKSKCELKFPFNNNVKEIMKSYNFKSLVSKLEFVGEEVKNENVSYLDKEIVEIDNINDFEKLCEDIKRTNDIAIYIDNNIYISLSNEREYIIKVSNDLFALDLSFENVINKIKSIIIDNKITVIGSDIKNVMHNLDTKELYDYDDVALKVYLLDSNRTYKKLEDMLSDYFVDAQGRFSLAIRELNKICDEKLKEKGLSKLYNEVEKPLVKVLYCMEIEGCSVDTDLILELKSKYDSEVNCLLEKIYSYNDNEPFNVNSTKKLGEFLFEKLKLSHGKKTKTGYSTDIEVLNNIKNEHEVVPYIIRYREVYKLLTTYVDGLGGLVKNGKIHTKFNQMVTATGRLSSQEPNLQNIPIRSEEGKVFRKMFTASNGNVLVCSDYSQIELRLLAHLSNDEVLINAFKNGEDIHRATASLVFGVPMELVSSEMRRQAKAVNFGIIYGISAFGLSNDIGVTPNIAKKFIEKYFETYPKVKEYMDSNISFAKQNGYVKTLYDRIRYIPEIKSTNFFTRSFGERIAMNTPLQGSASDIIKKAMIDVYNALESGGYKAKLILQVHDELLIDCPISEVDSVAKLLKECMENVVKLNVKLVADVASGKNWFEAK